MPSGLERTIEEYLGRMHAFKLSKRMVKFIERLCVQPMIAHNAPINNEGEYADLPLNEHISKLRMSRSGLLFVSYEPGDFCNRSELRRLNGKCPKVDVPGEGYRFDIFSPTCVTFHGKKLIFNDISFSTDHEPVSSEIARARFGTIMQKKVEGNWRFFAECLDAANGRTNPHRYDRVVKNIANYWNHWTSLPLPSLPEEDDADEDDGARNREELSEFLTPAERLVDPDTGSTTVEVLVYVDSALGVRDPANAALLKKLKWRKCPRRVCDAYHEKITGCYVVWCPQCKYKFEWDAGNPTGGHNPMEQEFLEAEQARATAAMDGRAFLDNEGLDQYLLTPYAYKVSFITTLLTNLDLIEVRYTYAYLDQIHLLYGTWEELRRCAVFKYKLSLLWPIVEVIKQRIVNAVRVSNTPDCPRLVESITDSLSEIREIAKRMRLNVGLIEKCLEGLIVMTKAFAKVDPMYVSLFESAAFYTHLFVNERGGGSLYDRNEVYTQENIIQTTCEKGCYVFANGIGEIPIDIVLERALFDRNQYLAQRGLPEDGEAALGTARFRRNLRYYILHVTKSVSKSPVICQHCHRFIYYGSRLLLPTENALGEDVPDDFIGIRYPCSHYDPKIRHLPFIASRTKEDGLTLEQCFSLKVRLENTEPGRQWSFYTDLDFSQLARGRRYGGDIYETKAAVLGELHSEKDSEEKEERKYRSILGTVAGLLRTQRAVLAGGSVLSLLDGEVPKDFDVYTNLDPTELRVYMATKGFVRRESYNIGYGKIALETFILAENYQETFPLVDENSIYTSRQENIPGFVNISTAEFEEVRYGTEFQVLPHSRDIHSPDEIVRLINGLPQLLSSGENEEFIKDIDNELVTISDSNRSFIEEGTVIKRYAAVLSAEYIVAGKRYETGKKSNTKIPYSIDVIYCQGMPMGDCGDKGKRPSWASLDDNGPSPGNSARAAPGSHFDPNADTFLPSSLSDVKDVLRFIEVEFDISVSKTCVAWNGKDFSVFSLYNDDLAARTFAFAFHKDMRTNIYKSNTMMKRCKKYQEEKDYVLRDGGSVMKIYHKQLIRMLDYHVHTARHHLKADQVKSAAESIRRNKYTLPNKRTVPKTVGEMDDLSVMKSSTNDNLYVDDSLQAFDSKYCLRYSVKAIMTYFGPDHRLCLDSTSKTQFMSLLLSQFFRTHSGELIWRIPDTTGNVEEQLDTMRHMYPGREEAWTKLINIPDFFLLSLPICKRE
jgi:hypothetical protein